VTQILPVMAYPVVLLMGVSLHLVLLQYMHSVIAATYIPIILSALFVVGLEWLIPARDEWKPNKYDVKNDAVYMAVIQLVLPKLLGLFFVLSLIEPLNHHGFAIENLWPHDWPLLGQLILMLVLAEFFRYWLHRAAHENAFLWRFHAVHHAPVRLYWLNVGRFHFVDKSLQFLFDVLPFMLLGVGEAVIALYIVCYSINGFFQHSNICLKFGWLNYLLSSAELHRWHHSKLTHESNRNYGNNLIIWDWVFGTWFLPKNRLVGSLGIRNPHYPISFIDQLKTPFIGGAQEKPMPKLSLWEIVKNGLLAIGMWRIERKLWKPLINAAHQPRQVQLSVLREIVSKNAQTRFGKEHSYSEIKSYEDFIRQVPIQTYETLRQYIKSQEKGEAGLTEEAPVMYALTSGTTGKPKLIPLLASTIKQLSDNQQLFSYLQYRQVPAAFTGKLLGIMGSAVEGKRDNGIPYGSVSGMMYQSMPKILKSKFVLPGCVFDIKDYELKYLVIARLAMAEIAITYMNSANPSTFMKLQQVIHEHQSLLIQDIAEGTFQQSEQLPVDILTALQPYFVAQPERANKLSQLARQYGALSYSVMWPFLQLMATWKGGSCGIAIDKIRPALPSQTVIMDVGYIASEFRGTVPLTTENIAGLPLLTDHFYEFVERHRWDHRLDGSELEFLLIDQCELGKDYYIFVTTRAGLVRYHMNDIVRVTDFVQHTPLLAFCQKGKGVTNITGEKLTEEQVLTAVKNLEQKTDLSIPFFIMQADEKQFCYKLWVEAASPVIDVHILESIIEEALFKFNIEYKSKRESGRLYPLTIYCLKPGTGDAYKQFMIQQGQRENQFKIMTLQYAKDMNFPMSEYVL